MKVKDSPLPSEQLCDTKLEFRQFCLNLPRLHVANHSIEHDQQLAHSGS